MAIDIGTNSTLHLVAEATGGEVAVVERGIVGNGLGAGLTRDGLITPTVLDENRWILERLLRRGAELGCVRSGAVGTHALRRAGNREEFIRMTDRLGLWLKVISDDEEAAMAWQGVFGGGGPREITGLLDLGGGSTELIVGNGSEPQWWSSVPVGAVMMARENFHSDPPAKPQVTSAVKAVRQAFALWQDRLPHGAALIGIAGTITSLIAVEQGDSSYRAGRFEGKNLTDRQVSGWMKRLLNLNLHERRTIPGMPPARAESIHAGALILNELLKIIRCSSVIVSEKGVLFGLALRLAGDEI